MKATYEEHSDAVALIEMNNVSVAAGGVPERAAVRTSTTSIDVLRMSTIGRSSVGTKNLKRVGLN